MFPLLHSFMMVPPGFMMDSDGDSDDDDDGPSDYPGRNPMTGSPLQDGAIGPQTSDSHPFPTYVGRTFVDYVDQIREGPFVPFHSFHDTYYKHTNLWVGRKLRLLLDPRKRHNHNRWRYAKVVYFDEYLHSPFFAAPMVRWDIGVEFIDVFDKKQPLDFEVGDLVKVRGKFNGTMHRGTTGLIREKKVQYSNNNNNMETSYVVFSSDKQERYTVKASNLSHVKTAEFRIHRINVEGGGTIKQIQHIEGCIDDEPLLSFEWLEEATPHVNLAQKWYLNCPVCRRKLDDQNMKEKQEENTNIDDTAPAECPICLETETCKVLACKHNVCTTCIKRIKKYPDGRTMIDPKDVEVVVSDKEIKKEHKRKRRLVPWRTDAFGRHKARDQDFRQLQMEMDFFIQEDHIINAMQLFKRWLITTPLAAWVVPFHYLHSLVQCAPIRYLDAIYDHLLSLRGTPEYAAFVRDLQMDMCFDNMKMFDQEEHRNPDTFFLYQMMSLTSWIGNIHADEGHFYVAITWFRKSCSYAEAYSKEALGWGLIFLGRAQVAAGLFDSAEKTFQLSVKEGRGKNKEDKENAQNRLKMLRKGMKENWKGSSGKMTPRMDS